MKLFSKRTLVFGVLLLGLTVVALIAEILSHPSAADQLLTHLRYLASDELRGRGNGQPELDEAARYIARHFEAHGLLPAGEKGSYFQEFEVTTARDLGPQTEVTIETKGRRIELEPTRDYVPLTFGKGESLHGSLVFAGFGISAPELNYDDYQNIDVRGKIALILEHEPQEIREDSPFAGDELSPYSTVLYKIGNARDRGAVAVFLMPDAFNHSPASPVQSAGAGEMEEIGIPALRLGKKWGEFLLRQSGREMSEVSVWVNRHLTPYSFQLESTASVTLDPVRVKKRLKNVLAWIPGRSQQTIIVGAHYDHLGLGGKGSLAYDLIGEVHNGADDNASGTAGLLCLASLFSTTSPRENLFFIAFSGEEIGLLGSGYYTANPTTPLDDVVAMINLDMIGRSEGSVTIGGAGTAKEFKEILDELQKTTSLELRYLESSSGYSDHLSFALRKVPVLLFFSGLHSDYHRPSDDWERIDIAGTAQILGVVQGVINRLMLLERPPQYRDVEGQAQLFESGRRFGTRFGSVPDLSWELEGVRFAQIVSHSPADKAGLKAEDVILGFDGKQVGNLYDFTSILKSKFPGDESEVLFLRKGQLLRTTIQLDTR